ncbi:unnamed protein product [Rhizophagus irregularis]|uniref:Protein kinase domain-containing protein n=1 Tax=Rhizophagus irregularis TaxID=588596 RepID=A0A915Z6Q0_9GLOM|nr:unnamed protein product [Rhizophagus irregularis]
MLRLEESDTKNTLKVLLDDETLRTIHRYEPQDFKDLTEIASGASAFVYYGRKNTSKFAIKKFKNPKEEAIIKEIHLMGIVSPHPNIITFYGVTKLDETNYSLVLEYADKTLRNYLRDDAIPFKWESQLNFAREIANAISWLHDDKEIIHGDLHPNNILINDDIYSLGVLFWELTSRSSPFNFEKRFDRDSIKLMILNRVRENPIPKTNDRFVSLYKKCWQHEPDERPPICQVIEELDSIDPIINNLPTNSNKSKITQDKDSDLNITTYSK